MLKRHLPPSTTWHMEVYYYISLRSCLSRISIQLWLQKQLFVDRVMITSKYKFYGEIYAFSWCTCACWVLTWHHKHQGNKGILVSFLCLIEAQKHNLNGAFLGASNVLSPDFDDNYMDVCFLFLKCTYLLYASLSLSRTYTDINRRQKKKKRKLKRGKILLKQSFIYLYSAIHVRFP